MREPRPPNMTLFLNAIRPSRHGERGTALSEVYYFSRHAWSKALTGANWTGIFSSRLFYTGYAIFGAAITVAVRKRLSWFLGSSCHIIEDQTVLVSKRNADAFGYQSLRVKNDLRRSSPQD